MGVVRLSVELAPDGEQAENRKATNKTPSRLPAEDLISKFDSSRFEVYDEKTLSSDYLVSLHFPILNGSVRIALDRRGGIPKGHAGQVS